MSTNGRRGPDVRSGSGGSGGRAPDGRNPGQQRHGEPGTLRAHVAADAAHPAGFSRKRRRRQRTQRGKRRGVGPSRPTHADTASRERMFQDIEGLLRQIREQAEESAGWTEQQLSEITQTVTAFTRSLEAEADPVSDRTRGEYQRIREKLSQALKN